MTDSEKVLLQNYKSSCLGEGEFGSVYKGSYMTDSGKVQEVAVKALSKETIEPHQVGCLSFL